MLGVVPPERRGLNVDSIGRQLSDDLFGSVGKSGGRVGGADESECSALLGIGKSGEGVVERGESICHSVEDVAIDVWVSHKTMNHLCSHYNI